MSSTEEEVRATLRLSEIFTRFLGLSLLSTSGRGEMFMQAVWAINLLLLVGGQFAYIVRQMAAGSSGLTVARLLGSNLHIAGYGALSAGKIISLWYKRSVLRLRISELSSLDLWPTASSKTEDDVAADVTRRSLASLRTLHFWYATFNVLGLVQYVVMPLLLSAWRRVLPDPPYLVAYPIDMSSPALHTLAYVFESVVGTASMCSMVGPDLVFTALASHVTMLLRLLRLRVVNLFSSSVSSSPSSPRDSTSRNTQIYARIVDVVKLHQRLITFSTDLEDAFSATNLINVVMSSFNICCVVFNIVLLDPISELANKCYLCAVTVQVGIICWYADDAFRASVDVSAAAYACGWEKMDARCRRAIFLLILRSQKPLYFTALKFSNITLMTFSSILTNSYSYFTLLYTMYNSQ